ncbi:MAG: hypothetical protein ABIS67_00125, partial [Candidatus Eisenbacteria bacterium]
MSPPLDGLAGALERGSLGADPREGAKLVPSRTRAGSYRPNLGRRDDPRGTCIFSLAAGSGNGILTGSWP